MAGGVYFLPWYLILYDSQERLQISSTPAGALFTEFIISSDQVVVFDTPFIKNMAPRAHAVLLLLASTSLTHCHALSFVTGTVPPASMVAPRVTLFARANADARRKASTAAKNRHGRRRKVAVNEFGVKQDNGPRRVSRVKVEVLLLSSVDGLGEAGDLVSVSSPMFQNVLLPKGKARIPSAAQLAKLKVK